MHTKCHFSLLFLFLILSSQFFTTTAHAVLPDTGQTKCYNASGTEISCVGTGQDGAYNSNPMSFTDNGDGTVTDNNTGLVWQKCSIGQNNDATCSGHVITHNWYQASGTYDAIYNPSSISICGTLSLAGGGWRLPTNKELISIVDYSISYPGPTIQQAYFPNTVLSYYWSSTMSVNSTSYASFIHFSSGVVSVYTKDNDGCVRCVRH